MHFIVSHRLGLFNFSTVSIMLCFLVSVLRGGTSMTDWLMTNQWRLTGLGWRHCGARYRRRRDVSSEPLQTVPSVPLYCDNPPEFLPAHSHNVYSLRLRSHCKSIYTASGKKDLHFFLNNFNKFKHIFTISGTHYPEAAFYTKHM